MVCDSPLGLMPPRLEVHFEWFLSCCVVKLEHACFLYT